MSSDHDGLRRLRDADPVSPERVKGAASQPRAQETLDRIIGEEPTPRAPRRGPLAVAAVLAIVSILVWVSVAERSQDVKLRTASVVLAEAAQTAANASLPQPGAGEYVYRRTELVDRVTQVTAKGAWTALVPRVREVWVAAGGSGRIREAPGRPIFPGPRDRSLWRRAGKPDLRGDVFDRRVKTAGLAPEAIAGLPEDPEALARTLLEDRVGLTLPPQVGLFVECADLLSDPLIEPELRSALYRVVADIDGIQLLGQVRDPSGRSGTGVAITSRSRDSLQRHVLIFEAETSKVLAEKVVLLEQVEWLDADPPVAIGSRVYGETGTVPSAEDRPSA